MLIALIRSTAWYNRLKIINIETLLKNEDFKKFWDDSEEQVKKIYDEMAEAENFVNQRKNSNQNAMTRELNKEILDSIKHGTNSEIFEKQQKKFHVLLYTHKPKKINVAINTRKKNQIFVDLNNYNLMGKKIN